MTIGSLPSGRVGVVYSQPLSATGGTLPYTWSLAPGHVLPSGLDLTAGGRLGGTPSRGGAFNFAVQVRDSAAPPATAQRAFQLVIEGPTAPLEIVSAGVLPAGREQIPYQATLAARGGQAPYQWRVVGGELPEGLTVSSEGVISGTPMKAQAAELTIEARDSASPLPATVSKLFRITIAAAPTSGHPSGQTLAISGRVLERGPQGLRGVAGIRMALSAHRQPVAGRATARTDAEGRYAFTELPGGEYVVRPQSGAQPGAVRIFRPAHRVVRLEDVSRTDVDFEAQWQRWRWSWEPSGSRWWRRRPLEPAGAPWSSDLLDVK